MFRLLPPGLRAHWVWLLPLGLLAAGVEAAGATAVFGLLRLLSPIRLSVTRVVAEWPMPDFVRTGGNRTVTLLMTVAVMALYVSRLVVLGAVEARNNASHSTPWSRCRTGRSPRPEGPFAIVAHRPSSEMILRVEWATEVAVGLGLSSVVQVVAEAHGGGWASHPCSWSPHRLQLVVARCCDCRPPASSSQVFRKSTFQMYGEREQVDGLAGRSNSCDRALAHCARLGSPVA